LERIQSQLEVKMLSWRVPDIIKNQDMLDRECDRLMKALQETKSKTVPYAVIGPHAKYWWTWELTNLRHDMIKSWQITCNLWHKNEDIPWEHFKDARQTLSRELEKITKNHWRDWLESIEAWSLDSTQICLCPTRRLW
jgi:hypothetical protein